MMPSEELEKEIMEFVFSNSCKDHNACLKMWNNNPWEAVSWYEIAMYPENIGLPLAFPEKVNLPRWLTNRLADEEMLAMKGDHIVLKFPRAEAGPLQTADGYTGEINKFGRVIIENDDEDEDSFPL